MLREDISEVQLKENKENKEIKENKENKEIKENKLTFNALETEFIPIASKPRLIEIEETCA